MLQGLQLQLPQQFDVQAFWAEVTMPESSQGNALFPQFVQNFLGSGYFAETWLFQKKPQPQDPKNILLVSDIVSLRKPFILAPKSNIIM